MTFGRYQEAVKAYQRANDIDKVVEIKMRFLDEVQQAFDLVRQVWMDGWMDIYHYLSITTYITPLFCPCIHPLTHLVNPIVRHVWMDG